MVNYYCPHCEVCLEFKERWVKNKNTIIKCARCSERFYSKDVETDSIVKSMLYLPVGLVNLAIPAPFWWAIKLYSVVIYFLLRYRWFRKTVVGLGISLSLVFFVSGIVGFFSAGRPVFGFLMSTLIAMSVSGVRSHFEKHFPCDKKKIIKRRFCLKELAMDDIQQNNKRKDKYDFEMLPNEIPVAIVIRNFEVFYLRRRVCLILIATLALQAFQVFDLRMNRSFFDLNALLSNFLIVLICWFVLQRQKALLEKLSFCLPFWGRAEINVLYGTFLLLFTKLANKGCPIFEAQWIASRYINNEYMKEVSMDYMHNLGGHKPSIKKEIEKRSFLELDISILDKVDEERYLLEILTEFGLQVLRKHSPFPESLKPCVS